MTSARGTVGVVGGGMLGLTLALRLRRQGWKVRVFEAAPSPGGLVSPQTLGGFVWDRFYHIILPADVHLLRLLAELGLESRVRWRPARSAFYADGRFHSLATLGDYLRFPVISFADKLRLAATIWYASRIRSGRRLEAVPVADWLRRLSGRRVFERVWLPLLRAKLGDNYRRTSAAFIWAYLRRLYRARRSGAKREVFGYVEGGYATVLRRLEERMTAAGVETVCGRRVERLRQTSEGVEIHLDDGRVHRVDHAILTIPSGAVAAICPQLTDPERDRLRSVVYQGVICGALLVRRGLEGYYLTNIADPSVPFTGVVEMTALVDPATFGGNALVYLPRYLAQDDPYWERDGAQVREDFLRGLEHMYPGFRREDVLAFTVSSARDVQALATMHFSQRTLVPTRTSLSRVFVVNSSQIVNGTLNVNETVALAERKLDEVVGLLQGAAPEREGVVA